MKQERKICFRITTWRIVGSILIAASAVNLIIVGAVSAVAAPLPTATHTITVPPIATRQITKSPPAAADTLTFTATNTFTPTATLTSTTTPTSTSTPAPSLTPCVPYYGWPIYTVQSGDTLSRIAVATGSTPNELRLANCLSSDLIFPGQLLYVPRLPATPTFTSTFTPTFTPSITPTYTFAAPVDTPTDFQEPSALSCDRYVVDFSVTAYDPQGITSVTVLVYADGYILLDQLSMTLNETRYEASTLSQKYLVADIAFYAFSALDGLGNNATTPAYDRSSIWCPLG